MSSVTPIISQESGKNLRAVFKSNFEAIKNRSSGDRDKAISTFAEAVAGKLGTPQAKSSRTISSFDNLLMNPITGRLDKDFADFIKALIAQTQTNESSLERQEFELEDFQADIQTMLAKPEDLKLSFNEANTSYKTDRNGDVSIRRFADAIYPDDTFNAHLKLGKIEYNLKVLFSKKSPSDKEYSSVSNIQLGNFKLDSSALKNIQGADDLINLLIEKRNESLSS